MKVRQEFTVAKPVDRVWKFLCDLPAVAVCIPGMDLTEQRDDGTCLGSFAIKVGPISTKLVGEGVFSRDDDSRCATLEGKGIDKLGGSRVTGTMRYAVVADGEVSVIKIEADIKLSGPLAQVGRTGIIEDVARTLTHKFATNVERRLTGAPNEAREQAEGARANGDGTTVGTAESPLEPHPERQSAREFDAGTAISKSLLRRIVRFFKRLFGLTSDEETKSQSGSS